MKRVNLLAGGPVDQWASELATITTVPGQWITADRGTLRLLQQGVTPTIAVGDFDSITPAEKEQVLAAVSDIRSVQAEKDETDTQLAYRLPLKNYRLTVWWSTVRLEAELTIS